MHFSWTPCFSRTLDLFPVKILQNESKVMQLNSNDMLDIHWSKLQYIFELFIKDVLKSCLRVDYCQLIQQEF